MTNIVVPLYLYPNVWVTPYNWTPIKTAKIAYPNVDFLCIINVNNGPGTTVVSDFQTGIADLKAVDVKFIGYVYTSYGQRSITQVKADIDLWYSLYGSTNIDGIHFDEFVGQTGSESYYQELYNYVKTKGGRGIVYVNPGAGVPESYVPTFDIACIWENTNSYPTQQQLIDRSFYPEYVGQKQFSVMIHSESTPDYTYITTNAKYIDWIYLTQDVLPNPYDVLPTYLQTLTEKLNDINENICITASSTNTLTNKTFPSGQLKLSQGSFKGTFVSQSLAVDRTWTMPDATGTLQTGSNSSTLSNKTLKTTTMADAANLILNTTTGTKIGTSPTQKLGFYNATPIVQPAANANTSGATLAQLETEVNELKAILRSLGLLAQ